MLNTCLDVLHNLDYFIIAHTQPFFLYQPIFYLIRIKVTICQTNLIMTLNRVKKGSQSYIAGLSQSCQKSVSSAHM